MTPPENDIIRAVFEETTGQEMPSPAEIEADSRALQKGYGEPYAAYRVGVLDGAKAALKMVEPAPLPQTQATPPT